MNKIKILMADDHLVVRRGLRSLIEQETDMAVVGEAGDGLELLNMIEQLRPDVALVDLKMPNLNGIDAAEDIHKRFPRTAIVILTMHADRAYIDRAFQAGVHGYVLKEDDIWELCTAIRHAAQGNHYLSSGISKQMPADIGEKTNHPNTMVLLTLRERQVFQLIAEGKKNNEIAKILGISVRTVEGHRANMMSKLNLKTQVDFVRYALKHGIYVEK